MSLRFPRLKAMLALTAALALVASVPAAAHPHRPTKPATPSFTDATVHDPDHIEVDGVHYMFGSHLQAASSTDLTNWTQIAEGVTPENPLFDDVTAELEEALTWAESDTLWAPDVIQLGDGRFYMYYNACKGDSPRSAMGLAVADSVTGPYRDLGIFLRSGMWGEPSEDGTIYDARIHPNVVDPDVFFSPDGRLWMVYGSYSGGLFSLELDPATGFPLPDQGYGTHLWGGNHARIEGPAVHYDPATRYYYLFVTYGGLDSTGGYNMRVARSKSPVGPYRDAEGRDMADVKADPTLPLFDDASIENTGVKLMGNFEFSRVVGDPGTGRGFGYVSPGGSTPFVDAKSGRLLLGFHTRFPGRGEEHQLRIHELTIDRSGWPVISPLRYAGKAAQPKKKEKVAVEGTYAVVRHAPRTIDASVVSAETLTLSRGGKVSGVLKGTWRHDGRDRIVLTVKGKRTQLLVGRGFDQEQGRWVTTLTGLEPTSTALWGVAREQVSEKQAVARVVADLTLPPSTIADLTLPTVGTQGSVISWKSSAPGVISTSGAVTRPEAGQADATAKLTATIRNGKAKATAQFTVTVPARQAGGLVASYRFDGDLTEDGGLAAGAVSGPRIGTGGGSMSFVDGVSGQAASFDGASGVRLPDGLVSGGTWSVSLWLKPTTTSPYTTAFFAARDADSWVSLLPEGHGGVGGNSMIWSGSAWYDAGFGRRLPVGEWSHVAFTVDSGKLTAWVDGEQVFNGAGFPDVLTTDEATFSLGVNWWDTPYQGAIDELRVYDSVLTDADVAALAG